jgi:hypothetical protein
MMFNFLTVQGTKSIDNWMENVLSEETTEQGQIIYLINIIKFKPI